MIEWSIEQALACPVIDRVVVSTDDPETASIARTMGAEIPFMRPAELADDNCGTGAVIQHTIRYLMAQETAGQLAHDERSWAVCCLYATAPFVSAADLSTGYDLLSGCDYVIPVAAYPAPVQRALRVDNLTEMRLHMAQPEKYRCRTQDLEPMYHDAGQFYWATAQAWCSDKSPYDLISHAMVVPRWKAVDIDTEEDWLLAEKLYAALYSIEQGDSRHLTDSRSVA